MIFGAHLSTAGGLSTAIDRAEAEGCDSVQIFTKNKGAWAAKPLSEEDIKTFRARAAASRVRPVVAHAAYLINIASPSSALRAKSVEALRIEAERCEALGIPYLVLHPGSHADTCEEDGLRRAAAALDSVHRSTRGYSVKVLLETSAGQGSSLCREFASLGSILRRVKEPERLGTCVDTCHIHASGYDIRTAEGYAATMDELEREVGLARVLCIHVNDSKKDLGSRVDRHEHIGKGSLGLEGLRRIVNDPRLSSVPFIFELPPDGGMTRVDLAALRGLVPGARKAAARKPSKTAKPGAPTGMGPNRGSSRAREGGPPRP